MSKSRAINIFPFIFTVILLLNSFGTKSFAQVKTKTQVTEFEILVKQTRDGIDLICKQGCAWKKLDFKTPNKYKPQAINQLGMTKISDADVANTDSQSFLFTIQKTDDGMSLKSMKGTAWETLSFSIKNGQERKLTEHGVIYLTKRSSGER